MSKNQKLKDIKLYQLAVTISEAVYALLPEFPEDEKWTMESSARSNAFFITSYLAEAYGSIDPRDAMWSFGKARRSLYSLENVFKMANKTGVLKLNPTIMLNIEAAVKMIDAEIEVSKAEIPKWLEQFEPQEEAKK